MDIARMVLEYLKALLSWPVSAIVIALLFFKLFKDRISDFLRRMVRGEAYGVRLEAATPSEQVKDVRQTLRLSQARFWQCRTGRCRDGDGLKPKSSTKGPL